MLTIKKLVVTIFLLSQIVIILAILSYRMLQQGLDDINNREAKY